jgi:Mn2+/Fe2+ NRAMP family transporter
VTLLVAVLGTTISPYLFFWQSAHRLEDMRSERLGGRRPAPLKERTTRQAQRKLLSARLDVIAGMAFSNVAMFAIITATAATLHAHGKTNLNSAADAARALEPLAGQWAGALFAVGFIGSGMLAIPVLAGSGAAGLAGLLGEKLGFSRPVATAPLFYSLVALGTVGGTVLTLTHVDPSSSWSSAPTSTGSPRLRSWCSSCASPAAAASWASIAMDASRPPSDGRRQH